MPPTVLSPVFAGRATELRLLGEAFEEAVAGDTQLVLIGAEAGGGKSRLVREFAARIGDRATVLTGRCVELTEAGLPYAPFTAVLRTLVRTRGAGQTAALAAHAPEFGLLLPDFGTRLPETTDSNLARARLFEVLRMLIERLAAERPLLLVIEDVHWADHATRDLLTFLAANLRHARVLLVVTYRAEEVTGSLRALLVELGRTDGVLGLSLPRLSRAEVADQLAGILGVPAPPVLVDAVHERGDGVPLFTESLVTTEGTIRAELPGSLRELLLMTVRELPAPTQEVLRIAAVGGARVSHSLLEALVGPGLTEALRPAVRVLTAEQDDYAFRHALIREAIRDDLLPGERRDLHRRYAETLQADSSLDPETWISAAIAVHRHAAGEARAALEAAWGAAGEAVQRLAYAEQLRMLELVLARWRTVPEATTLTGVDRDQVLDLAIDAACWAVESERGLELVEEALRTATGERVAALLLQRASMRRQLLQPGELDDLRTALGIATAPGRLRAEALGQLARMLILADRYDEAAPLVHELGELAARVGDEEFAIEHRIAAAMLAAHEGQDTRADFAAAITDAHRLGSGRLETLGYAGSARALEDYGDSAAAIDQARAGLARALEVGQARYIGAALAQSLADALTSAGRWDEALAVVDEALRVDPGPAGAIRLLLCAARIAEARGDHQTADRIHRSLPPDLPVRRPAGLRRTTPAGTAYKLTDDAERADDLASWDAAAEAWKRLGRPYPQAQALFRAAGAALAADDRTAAAARLQVAAELAHQLGAALIEQIADLARRARLDVPGLRPAPAVDHPFGLTARELDVLVLVAAGRTNREIAGELFISAKTASVHVSNILAKLGATTRGEAAALAHRHHLLNP